MKIGNQIRHRRTELNLSRDVYKRQLLNISVFNANPVILPHFQVLIQCVGKCNGTRCV